MDEALVQQRLEEGRAALEERFGHPAISTLDRILLQKMASSDQALMAIAVSIRPDDPLAAYKDLGGTYSVKE